MSKIEELEVELECSTSDIALGKQIGMPAWEIRMLKDRCDAESLLLIIRALKPKARHAMYKRGYTAKPAIKDKTDGGVLDSSKVSQTSNAAIQGMEFGKYLEGKNYYSDYDLMSAWDVRADSCHKKDTNDNDFLHSLNSVVGLRFMHGGNDDYYNRKNGLFSGRETVKKDEAFIVIGAYDQPFGITGLHALKTYYQKKNCLSNCEFQPANLALRIKMPVWPY